ncbi:hypothetical protein BU15DRAFT_67368 [Melanogaster broomeanus]|nr:hypothetical protein BU15DRAFT_67368 [Melanogaster broomeanus]
MAEWAVYQSDQLEFMGNLHESFFKESENARLGCECTEQYPDWLPIQKLQGNLSRASIALEMISPQSSKNIDSIDDANIRLLVALVDRKQAHGLRPLQVTQVITIHPVVPQISDHSFATRLQVIHFFVRVNPNCSSNSIFATRKQKEPTADPSFLALKFTILPPTDTSSHPVMRPIGFCGSITPHYQDIIYYRAAMCAPRTVGMDLSANSMGLKYDRKGESVENIEALRGHKLCIVKGLHPIEVSGPKNWADQCRSARVGYEMHRGVVCELEDRDFYAVGITKRLGNKEWSRSRVQILHKEISFHNPV